MFDINNKEITEGAYVQIIGCKVKSDNGIYIVDRKYEGREEFCLYKVKQNGEQAKTKYNIYFLNERTDKEKQIKIIAREELKHAAKEVKAYIEGRTAAETIYIFSVAENQTLQGLKEGQAIKFVKRVQLRGCLNSYSGTFLVTKIENGDCRLHLLGAKGDKIADNANGFYQFTPIHLNFKADTMQKLFDENYIEVLDRTESTKGEMEQEQDTASEPDQQTTTQNETTKQGTKEDETEQEKKIASICCGCKNFNSNNEWSCEGMEAVYTGCICYNKDANLPTIKINSKQPNEEHAQETTTEYKLIPEEIETTAEAQQGNTNNEYHVDNEQNAEQHTIAIKAVYYPINEANARTAKTINSFYAYTTDEATKVYKNHIAEVATLAQEKAEQHPERAGDIQELLNKYSKKYAEWKNRYYAIECMCPSVMVCGGGNFPVRKKEKQNKARDKHMQEYEYIQSILAKIENIGSQREQIKSSDGNAINKLQAKVDELTADLERAKAMNKYYRKNKTMRGFEGLTDERAAKIDNAITNAYSFDKQPAPSFELASIRAKIKTAEWRIAEIKRLKESVEQNAENQEQNQYKSDVCQVVENTELMRIQLLFDGKPSDEIRSILKSNGFRWSPLNSAWQRQLTDNARYTTKRVLEQISA